MKKQLLFLMMVALFCFCLAGCGNSNTGMSDRAEIRDTISTRGSNREDNNVAETTDETAGEPTEGIGDEAHISELTDTTEGSENNDVFGNVSAKENFTEEHSALKTEAEAMTGSENNQSLHIHTLQHHEQVPATCTENGTVEYWNCTECGRNYSDGNGTYELTSIELWAGGHNEIIDEAIPATCFSAGLTEGRHCSICGQLTVEQLFIGTLSHVSSEWIMDWQATENTEGSRHTECVVCGQVLRTEVIEKMQKQKLSTTTYTVNGISFKMILVEAGTFTMGSDSVNVAFSESPAHKVTLTQDYLIGESEVTEALWNAVMGNGGGSTSMPKTSITWNQAHDFIDRLNVIAHEQGLIPDDRNFRLPTEAQWEFAAKGGNLSNGYLYSGSDNINDVAQTLENTGSNSPVAVMQKSPNELGIYDMSGNAYEWVDDYAGSYSSEDQVDPQNTTVSRQYVKRGGSNYHAFDSESYLFTTTGRYFYGSTDWTIGFRIALQ